MTKAARPSQSQLRGGEAPRPTMRLIGWKPLVKNTLRGFADLELPNGLRIHEVLVLSSHGKCWASLPSKPVLDREGHHVETSGKKQYSAILEWCSRELADGFSEKVVALVRQAHPNALDGEAAP